MILKKGLRLRRKIRKFVSYINLLRFTIRKVFIGFDSANQFLQRLDKTSLQLILKRNGATIGHDCDLETGIRFHNCRDFSNLQIGNNCHIGKDCFFDLRDKVTIGDNVVISMQCTFITHIDMSKSDLTQKYPPRQAPIVIDDNVYIGARSQVLMGVKIEKRAFVAAKSLVKEDVESNTLVGGVPAKVIKKIKI